MPGLNLRMLEKRFAATEERERILEEKFHSKNRYSKRRMQDLDGDQDPDNDLRSSLAPLGDMRKGARATSQVVASSGEARAALQKQYVQSTSHIKSRVKDAIEDQQRRIEEIKREAAAEKAFREQKEADTVYRSSPVGGKVCFESDKQYASPSRPLSPNRRPGNITSTHQLQQDNFFARANKMASEAVENKVPAQNMEGHRPQDGFAGLFEGISHLSQIPTSISSAPLDPTTSAAASSKPSVQVANKISAPALSSTLQEALSGSSELLAHESRDTEVGIPFQRSDLEEDALGETQTPAAHHRRSHSDLLRPTSASSSPNGALSSNAQWRAKAAPSPFLANERKGQKTFDSVRTTHIFRTPSSIENRDARDGSVATAPPGAVQNTQPLFLTAVQRSLLQTKNTSRPTISFEQKDTPSRQGRPATATTFQHGAVNRVPSLSAAKPQAANTLTATAALSAARYRNPRPVLIPNRPWTAGNAAKGGRPLRPAQSTNASSQDDEEDNDAYNTYAEDEDHHSDTIKRPASSGGVIKGNFKSHYKSPAAALAALRHILAPGIGIPPPPRVPPKFYPKQVSRPSSPTDPIDEDSTEANPDQSKFRKQPANTNLYDEATNFALDSIPISGLNAHFAQLTKCPPAATMKDFYYIHIKVQHQSSLAEWLFTVVITDVTPVSMVEEKIREADQSSPTSPEEEKKDRAGFPNVIPPATTQTNLLLLNGVHTNTASFDRGAGLGGEIGVGVGSGGLTTTTGAAAAEINNRRAAGAGVSMVQTRPLSGAGKPSGVGMMISKGAAAAIPSKHTTPQTHVLNIYRHTISGVRVNEHKYLVFHPPTGTTFSPVEDIPWVPCPSYLFGRSLRIEVFATRPSRTKVVDTTVSFGED